MYYNKTMDSNIAITYYSGIHFNEQIRYVERMYCCNIITYGSLMYCQEGITLNKAMDYCYHDIACR